MTLNTRLAAYEPLPPAFCSARITQDYMTTQTFITILAWPLCIYTGLVVIVNTGTYLGLRANAKGWVIFALFILSLWWLLCK